MICPRCRDLTASGLMMANVRSISGQLYRDWKGQHHRTREAER